MGNTEAVLGPTRKESEPECSSEHGLPKQAHCVYVGSNIREGKATVYGDSATSDDIREPDLGRRQQERKDTAGSPNGDRKDPSKSAPQGHRGIQIGPTPHPRARIQCTTDRHLPPTAKDPTLRPHGEPAMPETHYEDDSETPKRRD